MLLMLGSFLGFISVALGAYADHVLQMQVSAEHFHILMTAIHYQQIHAVIIAMLGLGILGSNKLTSMRLLPYVGYGFVIGTMLFSFSIYAAVVFSLPYLTKLAPIGGNLLMASWLTLAYCGIRLKK